MTDDAIIPCIAGLGEDKLVILRRKSPILKVINVVTKKTRDITVELSKEQIGNLWSVDVDNNGHFIVTHGKGTYLHTLVIDTDGTKMHDIKCGHPYRPTFCRLTGMLTLCGNTSDTISCYKMNGTSLYNIMSVSHGVKGFTCYDICSGSLGEIFIAGEGEEKEDGTVVIRLYQVDLDTDKKTVSMKEIEIKGEPMVAKSDAHPHCSVNGNCLVIGYGNTMRVLKLSA
jgi:hypothetical protein